MKRFSFACLFLFTSMQGMEERSQPRDTIPAKTDNFELDTAFKIGELLVTELHMLGNDPDRILGASEHIRELFIRPEQNDATIAIPRESSSYLDRLEKLQNQNTPNHREQIVDKLKKEKNEYAAKIACDVYGKHLIRLFVNGLYHEIYGVHSKFEIDRQKFNSDDLLCAEAEEALVAMQKSSDDTSSDDSLISKKKRKKLHKKNSREAKRQKIAAISDSASDSESESEENNFMDWIVKEYKFDLTKISDGSKKELTCPIDECNTAIKANKYSVTRMLAMHLGGAHKPLVARIHQRYDQTSSFITELFKMAKENNHSKN